MKGSDGIGDRIRYHYDADGAWWADSPDLEGFTAAGESFDDVREQARAGVVFFSETPVMIAEAGVPEGETQSSAVGAFAASVEVSGMFGDFVVAASVLKAPRFEAPRPAEVEFANVSRAIAFVAEPA